MTTQVLRIDDLNPDGVRIVINWDAFGVGTSMFIPCIATDTAVKQVKKICQVKGFRVECRVVTHSKRMGVRVWRMS